ncbi:MAG: efflux RND transporter permease subunit, partial [Candidatus Cloacimonetes bacterium]|nr:efflux RND transporter permease subunit [Candidatus Cloacimonadota bacterium]
MSLAKFSVNNKVVVNMFMIIIFILGFSSMITIPKESRPAIDFGSASIRVSYPGVSPAEIEYQIVKKIEEQIQNLDDVDYYTSNAQEGSATVRVFFDAKADSDKCFDKLVNQIAKITDFPPDAGDPVLMQMKMRELNEMADIALTGSFTPNTLREIAEELQERLLNIQYMSKVEIHGVQERQVHIDIDMDVMNQLGLTFSELTALIQNRNMNVPGGTVNFGHAEFIVRTMGEFTSTYELGSLIVKSDQQSRAISLSDIADIEDGLEERTVISKLDGKDCVTLQVYKKAEGNIIDVMQEVREVVAEYADTVPGLVAIVRNDDSIDVKKSVVNLATSGVQGIILVFIILWLFIGYKNSILVSIGIPFSFAMTIWLMTYVDMTINNMSMFGLLLVLGLIVDNSIVIIENVWRHIEMGLSVKEATIKGANEVTVPVIAAVATTIVAFLPILLTEGRIGRFIGAFPIIVTLALTASFIQSVMILPAHITQFVKPKKVSGHKKDSHFYHNIQRGYQRILFIVLKNRGKAILTVTLSLFICAFVLLSGPIKFDFFPRRPAPSMTLRIKTPVGTNLENTNKVIAQVEEFLLNMPESVDIEAIVSTVGQMRENRQWKRESSNAELKLDLVDSQKRQFTNQAIRMRVRDFLSSHSGVYTFSFDETRGGPPVGLDMDIRVRGDDLGRLEYIAKYIAEEAEKLPGVADIENSFNPGKEELKLLPVYEKLAMYGITVSQIAGVVRTASQGTTVSKFRGTGIDEYDVILRAKESQITSYEDLKHLKIKTDAGQLIQLDEIVIFDATRGYAGIDHYD